MRFNPHIPVSAPNQMHTRIKDVLVLVYDTTSKRSFKDISGIFDAHPRNVITVLVGNKTDLGEQREVQKHEGIELARKLGASLWEVFIPMAAQSKWSIEAGDL